MSLERGDALAKSLWYKRSESLDDPSMLSTNNMMIVPYEIAKVSLYVAFDDHTMTLRMSIHIQ